jgi:hypothetical protein
VREIRSPASVRGAARKGRPYQDGPQRPRRQGESSADPSPHPKLCPATSAPDARRPAVAHAPRRATSEVHRVQRAVAKAARKQTMPSARVPAMAQNC